MARHRPRHDHSCTTHTEALLDRLEPLLPCTDEEDTPVLPAELADWIGVEAEEEPEVEGHGWRVDLDDEVGLLVHSDRDDLADSLADLPCVRSVVQLDREVLVVDAPSLCADGLRAAVVQAVVAANAKALAEPEGPPAVPSVHEPARTETAETDPEVDKHIPRLVTGDARCEGGRVQVWVNWDGILVLPAGSLPHGPLDPGDNPRYQRAGFTTAEVPGLVREHGGRWISYPDVAMLQLHRPGPFRRRWSATVTDRQGGSLSFAWKGTRPHAMLLWGYVVARCGLERVDGLP